MRVHGDDWPKLVGGTIGWTEASERRKAEAALRKLELSDFVRAVAALAPAESFPHYDSNVMAKTSIERALPGNRDTAVIAESPPKLESTENHDSTVRVPDVR